MDLLNFIQSMNRNGCPKPNQDVPKKKKKYKLFFSGKLKKKRQAKKDVSGPYEDPSTKVEKMISQALSQGDTGKKGFKERKLPSSFFKEPRRKTSEQSIDCSASTLPSCFSEESLCDKGSVSVNEEQSVTSPLYSPRSVMSPGISSVFSNLDLTSPLSGSHVSNGEFNDFKIPNAQLTSESAECTTGNERDLTGSANKKHRRCMSESHCAISRKPSSLIGVDSQASSSVNLVSAQGSQDESQSFFVSSLQSSSQHQRQGSFDSVILQKKDSLSGLNSPPVQTSTPFESPVTDALSEEVPLSKTSPRFDSNSSFRDSNEIRSNTKEVEDFRERQVRLLQVQLKRQELNKQLQELERQEATMQTNWSYGKPIVENNTHNTILTPHPSTDRLNLTSTSTTETSFNHHVTYPQPEEAINSLSSTQSCDVYRPVIGSFNLSSSLGISDVDNALGLSSNPIIGNTLNTSTDFGGSITDCTHTRKDSGYDSISLHGQHSNYNAPLCMEAIDMMAGPHNTFSSLESSANVDLVNGLYPSQQLIGGNPDQLKTNAW
eukprot:Nk52_evm119s485 gene=Nk52_evmTU119s485